MVSTHSRKLGASGLLLAVASLLWATPALAEGVSEDARMLMRIAKADKTPKGLKKTALRKVAGHLERDEHGKAEEVWRSASRAISPGQDMREAIHHVLYLALDATHPDVIRDARWAADRITTLTAIEKQIERLKAARDQLRSGQSTVKVPTLEIDISDTPEPPRLEAARPMGMEGVRAQMKTMRKEHRYAKKQAKMARLRMENGLRRATRMSRRMSRAWRMLNGIAMAKR
ncbi:MAG: hypothetical protein ACE366_13450 [Bradymonadia bacterium]